MTTGHPRARALGPPRAGGRCPEGARSSARGSRGTPGCRRELSEHQELAQEERSGSFLRGDHVSTNLETSVIVRSRDNEEGAFGSDSRSTYYAQLYVPLGPVRTPPPAPASPPRVRGLASQTPSLQARPAATAPPTRQGVGGRSGSSAMPSRAGTVRAGSCPRKGSPPSQGLRALGVVAAP